MASEPSAKRRRPNDDLPSSSPLNQNAQSIQGRSRDGDRQNWDGDDVILVPESSPPSALSPVRKDVVQVPASSPLPPVSNVQRPAPQVNMGRGGGILASALAPAGTGFRPPVLPTLKPSVTIDLLTDDEDDHSTNSKKTNTPPLRTGSAGAYPSPTGGRLNSIKAPVSARDKFSSITAGAFYRPSQQKPVSVDKPLFKSSSYFNSDSALVHRKPQRAPSKAVVQEDIFLEDIGDRTLREKCRRIKEILPMLSILIIQNALLKKNGNVDDALGLLAELHIDELNVDDTTSKPTLVPRGVHTSKREVKAPHRTITDKWGSNKLNESVTKKVPLVEAELGPVPVASKPLRRLVKRGKLVRKSDKASSDEERLAESDSDSDASEEAVKTDDALTRKVLNFFNSCNLKDLIDIAVTDEETANLVISKRPFRNLDGIREITTESTSITKTGKERVHVRAVGGRLVDVCLETWQGYDAVDELVSQCEGLSVPIYSTMKTWGIDPSGAKSGELDILQLDDKHDSGIGTPESEMHEDSIRSGTRNTKFLKQPQIMSQDITLKDYQLVGLNWLSLLYKHKLSCILADEMGLGKTCQVISFLAHLLEIGEKGPHLIVVPASTLENWLREFQTFCPALNVEPYYGSQKEREELRLQIEGDIENINIIVTTYQLASGNKIDTGFLRDLQPVVCVYDEGHYLKNSESARYASLMRIKAKFRLLLTGTPLQNNLLELASLLSFILPSVFAKRKEDLSYIFKHRAKTTEQNHDALLSAQRIERAKNMLTPFVLRRKKQQVLKDIPAKTNRVVYCDMMLDQYEIYTQEVERGQQVIRDRAEGKKVSKASANIIMQLRQAAIHSLLFRRIYNDKVLTRMSKACMPEQHPDARQEFVFQDMQVMTDMQLDKLCRDSYPRTLRKYALPETACMNSGKVVKLIEILKESAPRGDRTLVFSQFTMVLDILEEALSLHGLSFFRLDGSTPVQERQDMLDEFHEDTSIPVFLLSTKAGGSGINLACANKVIIFDASFNPQEDLQAENRAHRVGQTREVEVLRFVTKGTIEEQMMALGASKLTLDSRVSGVDAKDSNPGSGTSTPALGGSTAGLDEGDDKAIAEEGERLVAKMLLAGGSNAANAGKGSILMPKREDVIDSNAVVVPKFEDNDADQEEVKAKDEDVKMDDAAVEKKDAAVNDAVDDDEPKKPRRRLVQKAKEEKKVKDENAPKRGPGRPRKIKPEVEGGDEKVGSAKKGKKDEEKEKGNGIMKWMTKKDVKKEDGGELKKDETSAVSAEAVGSDVKNGEEDNKEPKKDEKTNGDVSKVTQGGSQAEEKKVEEAGHTEVNMEDA